MKGRKPRTPEQKAYIAAQRLLDKRALKLDSAENLYNEAIEHLREVELTVPPDELAAVQKLFPEGEKNPTFTGNISFNPENAITIL